MSRVGYYCACGGSCVGTVSPDRDVVKVREALRAAHCSPECRPCSRDEAAAARRRNIKRGEADA